MFIKKIFGVILLLAIMSLSQSVSAEKTDWFDRNFNFRNIRTVIVFDVTAARDLNYGGAIVLRNMQDTFIQSAKKLKCHVITESEARRMLGYQLGINLEGMYRDEARQFIIQNAYRIADAGIFGNLDDFANNYYIQPERTVWEQRKETRTHYDRNGNRRVETYYVQVPVTYPPRRVDVSTIQMTMEVYETRTQQMIFTRRDVRDREDYQAQKGMYGRICNSFFEDFGKKLR